MIRQKKQVRLLFPPSDERYAHRVIGYSSRPSPPQTAHAVLAAWIRKFSKREVLVEALSDQKQVNKEFVERSSKEFVEFTKDADVVGITVWYHNLENALSLSAKVKKENPDSRIVFGGPGVSNPIITKLILRKHPQVDFVVEGDGEDAFLGLVHGDSVDNIPNIWYRKDGAEKFSFHQTVDLNKMPLWDFSDTREYAELLESHRNLEENGQSMIGVFSNRGCPKARKKGPCIFCSSNIGGSDIRILPPEMFWEQRKRLQEVHGISDTFCSDNVFTLSFQHVKRIADAKGNHSDLLKTRIYSYPTDIIGKGGSQLVEMLAETGVYNVLFGIESLDGEVNSSANKDSFNTKTIDQAIELLRNGGIGTSLSFILGLPGESGSSLAAMKSGFSYLMKKYGNKGIQRVYLSLGMPLIGTLWYESLLSDATVRTSYRNATGIDLEEDVTVRYDILRELSIARFSSVGKMSEVYDAVRELRKMARDHLPEDRIGGYGLEEVRG